MEPGGAEKDGSEKRGFRDERHGSHDFHVLDDRANRCGGDVWLRTDPRCLKTGEVALLEASRRNRVDGRNIRDGLRRLCGGR